MEEGWLQWQVLVCALIFILPTWIAIKLIRNNNNNNSNNNIDHVWMPCWTNLHPRCLLYYRAFAFVSMAFTLCQTVASFGFFSFFFYTQWTFALVMLYFAVATIVSIKGCRRKLILAHDGLKKEDQTTFDHHFGFLENLLQIIYLTCGGAVLLTDIVFWCLLLPFMAGDDFKLTLMIGLMHSVNALFLLIESLLNLMPFHWFGIVYFVLWSGAYIVFQWVLHACCFTWWPYPFLDLSTPWAPLWYLALALVHIPCYGLYVLLMKGKNALLSRMFPHTFRSVDYYKKLESRVGNNLPPPVEDVGFLAGFFTRKGMSVTQMVALSGAHSIGVTQCGSFSNRLYSFNDTMKQDPSLDPKFASFLKSKCPDNGGSAANVINLDVVTPNKLDNQYFKNLNMKAGSCLPTRRWRAVA